MRIRSRTVAAATLALAATACAYSPGELPGSPPAAAAAATQSGPAGGTPASGCLPGERGFLRASLRGALEADLDWRGTDIQCEGGARPDGEGVRLSLAGPLDANGQRVRLVFGIAVRPGVASTEPLPVNITVIVEGGGKLFATLGDQRCTVDSLTQQSLPATGKAGSRDFRVAARGFCVDPATTLNGSERLYINRFDLAGLARFEDTELHDSSATSTHTT